MYTVFIQRHMSLQITSLYDYKIVTFELFYRKKHCDIHDIMKNKKIPLIQIFFEHNAFGKSLLFSLFIF